MNIQIKGILNKNQFSPAENTKSFCLDLENESMCLSGLKSLGFDQTFSSNWAPHKRGMIVVP